MVLYQKKVLNCGFGLVVICDIHEIEDKCGCYCCHRDCKPLAVLRTLIINV